MTDGLSQWGRQPAHVVQGEMDRPGCWRTSLCLRVCSFVLASRNRGSTAITSRAPHDAPEAGSGGGGCTAASLFPRSPVQQELREALTAQRGYDFVQSHTARAGSQICPGLSDSSQAPNPVPPSPKGSCTPFGAHKRAAAGCGTEHICPPLLSSAEELLTWAAPGNLGAEAPI